MTNIQSGFQASGIYPLNREVSSKLAFAPASVTDRPNSDCSPTTNLNSPPFACQMMHTPHSQAINKPTEALPFEACFSSGCSRVTPEELRPFPKAGPRKMTKNRKIRVSLSSLIPQWRKRFKKKRQRMKKIYSLQLKRKKSKASKNKIKRRKRHAIESSSFVSLKYNCCHKCTSCIWLCVPFEQISLEQCKVTLFQPDTLCFHYTLKWDWHSIVLFWNLNESKKCDNQPRSPLLLFVKQVLWASGRSSVLVVVLSHWVSVKVWVSRVFSLRTLFVWFSPATW